eukprot:2565770-Alexandrium_andersonii.AAC.1
MRASTQKHTPRRPGWPRTSSEQARTRIHARAPSRTRALARERARCTHTNARTRDARDGT